MTRERRSLSLSHAATDDDESHWPAFGDIALALLLVFVVFILAQFLHYDRIFILERLEARQDSVRDAILANVDSLKRNLVRIDLIDAYHQRVVFQEQLLFSTCGSAMSTSGDSLIGNVGKALREFPSFFEAIQVEGHADPRPPTNCAVPDNWVLSSERATEVLRVLSRDATSTVQQALLSAVGRGHYHPATYTGPEISQDDSLALHRRVELVLQYTDRGILGSVR